MSLLQVLHVPSNPTVPRKAPNDPNELKAAAQAAGLDGDAVLDKSFAASETQEEMKVGQKLRAAGQLTIFTVLVNRCSFLPCFWMFLDLK